MGIFNDMERVITDLVIDLEPAPEVPDNEVPMTDKIFDHTEKDNSKWIALITGYLNGAKTFEIHCWNEESEWIELARQYGELKDDNWKYGKIIKGNVTKPFIEMILKQPKPKDTEIYNKMTPFFNIFLDDNFQSCHYGTENYYK